MDGLEHVVGRISSADVRGELWLDGSFLTQKIDPMDVDYLLRVGSDIYDHDPEKRTIVDWASSAELKDSCSCDAYKWIEYNVGHPLFADSERDREYWTNWYGVSRKGIRKGIAVVTLPAVL